MVAQPVHRPDGGGVALLRIVVAEYNYTYFTFRLRYLEFILLASYELIRALDLW